MKSVAQATWNGSMGCIFVFSFDVFPCSVPHWFQLLFNDDWWVVWKENCDSCLAKHQFVRKSLTWWYVRTDKVLSKQKECGKRETHLLLVDKRKLEANSILYLVRMFLPVIVWFCFLKRKKLLLSLLLVREMITRKTLKEKAALLCKISLFINSIRVSKRVQVLSVSEWLASFVRNVTMKWEGADWKRGCRHLPRSRGKEIRNNGVKQKKNQ